MDQRDQPSDGLTGAACGACGRPVPAERVRVLASRDDLAFAELPCGPCGSISLAIFVGGVEDLDAQVGAERAPPLGPDDVLDMHLFLAGWSGDLSSLVEPSGGARGGPGTP